MTQPENYTAAQACDPQTPGQVLADIAAVRPDLRAALAANPNVQPDLLEWLRGLGDPALNAAIAARAGQPHQPMGAAPFGPAGAPAYGTPPQAGAPMYGTPPQAGAPMGAGFGAGGQGQSNKTLFIIVGAVGAMILIGLLIFAFRPKSTEDKCRDGDLDACTQLIREELENSGLGDLG